MKVTRRNFSKLAGAAAIGVGAGLSFSVGAAARAADQTVHANQPLFLKSQDLKWRQLVPDLGESSPEIAILRVDPATQATHLMIRNPKMMHVPRHWHSANETHTVLAGSMVFECDGQRETLGPGGFNYIPGKLVHQAWLPDNGWLLITVDAAWDIHWVDAPPGPAMLGQAPPK